MKKRIFKAFVCKGFRNVGQAYGFPTKAERDEFVAQIENARNHGFVDLTPRQFREWQQDGVWCDEIKGICRLARPGIDNELPFCRLDGKPETRWGHTPDPRWPDRKED